MSLIFCRNKETKGRDKTGSMMMTSGSEVVILPSPKPREATKGNTNTSPNQQNNFSSLSNSDLKTNVLSSDKSKAVKPTSKANYTRCFKCHRIGYYANKCQNQKPLVTLENENVETEQEKEEFSDPLQIFDDYTHEPMAVMIYVHCLTHIFQKTSPLRMKSLGECSQLSYGAPRRRIRTNGVQMWELCNLTIRRPSVVANLGHTDRPAHILILTAKEPLGSDEPRR
ncbi:hypothetical protein YC2023_024194 [Brassica napus]